MKYELLCILSDNLSKQALVVLCVKRNFNWTLNSAKIVVYFVEKSFGWKALEDGVIINVEYVITLNMQMKCTSTFPKNTSTPTPKCDKMASSQVEKFSLRSNVSNEWKWNYYAIKVNLLNSYANLCSEK